MVGSVSNLATTSTQDCFRLTWAPRHIANIVRQAGTWDCMPRLTFTYAYGQRVARLGCIASMITVQTSEHRLTSPPSGDAHLRIFEREFRVRERKKRS
jgi:hypothetical protein